MKNEIERSDFDRMVTACYEQVYRTALGFVHSVEDAEDVTQEVFLRAYKSRGSYRGEAAHATWLYRITIHVSIDFCKARKRRNLLQVGEEFFLSLFQRRSEEEDPQRTLESKQEQESIRRAIDSLPEKQRTAFILTRYDDLPQKEVAEVMGISLRAVEQLLLRAKQNLQKELGEGIRK